MLQLFKQGLVKYFCLIGMLLVTACNFPSQTQVSATQEITPQIESATQLPPVALVTFQAQVPPNTPPQDKILIRLLDEVTGLPFNARQYELKPVAEGLYEIYLPFQVGSDIKYRYAHLNTYLNEEYTTIDQLVRYRLFHVDGPASVQDVVSAWSDLNPNTSTGRITGSITDRTTGAPLPGLLVFAGGAQTQTAADGTFQLDGLPEGIHNLVVYAKDGSYLTFQQGAQVSSGLTTPAQIAMQPAPMTKIIFHLTAPKDTLQGVPIRLAGSLLQLGNTFTDLHGGGSVQPLSMPTLNPLPDGTYQIEMQLPTGAYIEYKFTLGDGYWNAEHTPDGAFRLRSLVVPEQDLVIEDNVDSWSSGSTAGPIFFDLKVPDTSTQFDYVSIQLNNGAWDEPIPMWSLDKYHWVYLLYSPLNSQSEILYRYCRNNECIFEDNLPTLALPIPDRTVELSDGYQRVNDQITPQDWLNP